MRHVVGRQVGVFPGYNYSPGLRAADFTWDPRTLDLWLRNPSGLIPRARMRAHLDDPDDRRAVIAFLASQSRTQP